MGIAQYTVLRLKKLQIFYCGANNQKKNQEAGNGPPEPGGVDDDVVFNGFL